MGTSREQLIFDVLANTGVAGRNLTDLGRKAGAASDDVMGLARRLDEVSKKSATARVALEGDKDAQAKLDKLDFKMATIGSKVMRPDITVEGAARASFELAALDAEMDKIGRKGGSADAAAAATTGLAGTNVSGMGALIAGGVVLSPMLVTLGIGLGGVAAAAYGVAKPIEMAAQKAGGLQANMAKLNPEQQQVARGLLSLGGQFGTFEKRIQPAILGDFNDGLRLASHLLGDAEPVARATASALGGVLASVDKEFQSGEWKSFFGWMAAQAGPDVRQLGDLFTGLLHDLPPLVQGLQPLASGLIGVATDATKVFGALNQVHAALPVTGAVAGAFVAGPLGALIGGLIGVSGELSKLHTSVDATIPSWTRSGQATTAAVISLGAFGPQVAKYIQWLHQTDQAGRSTSEVQAEFAHRSDAVTYALAQQTRQLNLAAAGYEHALGPLEKYIGAQITEASDLHSLNQALRASHDQIGLKTAAERNSFAAAQTYIQDTINQGNAALGAHKGIDAQITSIRNALPMLEQVKGKTADYRSELNLLKQMLDELRAERAISERIKVFGTGSWTVQGSGVVHGFGGHTGSPMATGGRVPPGYPNDTYLARLTSGESVVPPHLTPAIAPFLAMHGVPGFAAGVIGSYSGSPAGLPPWTQHNWNASIASVTASIGNSIAGSIQNALTAPIPSGMGGNVAGWLRTAMGIDREPASWFGPMMVLISKESGGNPLAQNPISVLGQHASGIAQMLPSTFANWTLGGSIWNPIANLVASMRYIGNLYGSPGNIPGLLGGNYQGYDQGGWLHPGVTVAVNNTGRPERVLPPGRSHEGPLVQFGDVIVNNQTDEAAVRQKLSFAIVAAGLGA